MNPWDDHYRDGHYRTWPNEMLVSWTMRTFPPEDFPRGPKALDLGCGAGANCWFLASCGFLVTGIDASKVAIDVAKNFRERHDPYWWNLSQCDFLRECQSWIGGAWDLVTDVTCLQHLTDLEHKTAVAEINRLLNPGGRFFSYRLGFGTHYASVFPGNPPVWMATADEIREQLVSAGFQTPRILRHEREYPHGKWAKYLVVEATK